MAVLYRKYRPKTFTEVIGQKPIVETLIHAIEKGVIAHAYLFTGSRGVGKTTIARVLARAINCTNSTHGEPCGTCEVCTAFASGSFLDMVEIDAASNNGVDNVRELLEHVKFRPTLGKYKVFIIDEVHMLSKGAFNALLKTLEEPPEHVVFILATTELAKLPATIISRTQRFDFKRVPEQAIVEYLEHVTRQEKQKISTDILALVARQAEGSMRDALSILGKLTTMPGLDFAEAQAFLGITSTELSEKLFRIITSGDARGIPAYFESITTQGIDPLLFTKDFLQYLRSVLVLKVSPDASITNLSDAESAVVHTIAQQVTVADLMFIIRLFLKAYKDVSTSVDELPVLIAAIEASLKFSSTQGVPTGLAQPKAQQNIVEPPVLTSSTVPHVETKIETSVEPAVSTSSITREELVLAWPAVCDYVKTTNAPLATLIRNSSIEGVVDGKVVLGVKFLFHKENIEATKNQSLIGNAIAHILGAPLGVRGEIVAAKTEQVAKNVTGLVGDALSVFGGELVE